MTKLASRPLLTVGTLVLLASTANSTSSADRFDPPKKLTLVYNINNGGYIDVCGCKHKEVRQGSLTRRSAFLKQLRSTGREILLVDGGSALFPIKEHVKKEELAESMRKAELIVEAYNRMGYRVMAVGAFDLAAGLDNLKKLEKKAKFELLSANLADAETGKLHFKPHTVIETGGIRVGFFGLTLDTLTKVYLEKVAPPSKPSRVSDLVLLDPVEAARNAVKELEGKADLIVAVSHVREETNFELAKALAGLQVVVDPFIQYGNHHTWIKEPEWVTFQGDTVFLRSDGQGARLGVLDIEMVAPRGMLASADRAAELEELVAAGSAAESDRAELQALRGKNPFEFTLVSLEPHHSTDPDLDHLIEEWKKNIDPATVKRLEAALPLKDQYLTTEKCASCHEKQHEFWKGTRHARAMASLVATGDHQRFDCVGCHSLGYGQAFLDTTNIGKYAEVQCESCHGTNPRHAADPKANKFAVVQKDTCLACHNKSQTLVDFNFFRSRREVACPKG
jgi:2',3'-cyclic-nucleotide 2'-phosphodiesterase (5'-nucleotidase family)